MAVSSSPLSLSSSKELSSSQFVSSSSSPSSPPFTSLQSDGKPVSHSNTGHVNGLSHSAPQSSSSQPKQSPSLDASNSAEKAVHAGLPHSVLEQSTRALHKEEQNNDLEPDKPEDASMSPTLTVNKSVSTKAIRKADNLSLSDAPQALASHLNGVKPASTRSSTSTFFSRLFHFLVPCVSPSSSHQTDIDTIPPPISPEPSPIQHEKNAVSSVEEKNITLANPSQNIPLADTQPESNQDTTSSCQEQPITQTVQEETEIILPPTPTLLPEAETEGVTSGAVQAPGSTGTPPAHDKHHHHHKDGDESEGTSFTEDDDLEDVNGIDEEDEEDKLILSGGAGIPIGPDGVPKPLLPPISPLHVGRKCLVLDLDETLVHSSFKSIQQADYVVPVEIEYHWHNVYVIKRPGVDNFLKKMGEIYEVVVFTASLSKYADPVLDKLDIHQVVSHRLFRESCYNHKGNYVKDLSQLGRPISDTIILDNSPASYIFHPNNAVPVSSWFNDPHDTELTDLVPFLTDLSAVDDVRGILDGAR